MHSCFCQTMTAWTQSNKIIRLIGFVRIFKTPKRNYMMNFQILCSSTIPAVIIISLKNLFTPFFPLITVIIFIVIPQTLLTDSFHRLFRKGNPICLGLHNFGWQVKFLLIQNFHCPKPQAFKAGNSFGNCHFTKVFSSSGNIF